MNVLIAGGTGFIGKAVCRELIERGHRVTVLTRNQARARLTLPPPAYIFEWEHENWNSLDRHIAGMDAIVNLAGEPIADTRWTAPRKRQLRESRIFTTRLLVSAVSRLPPSVRPRAFISASGIGYYGIQPSAPVNESSPPGEGFLADLCQEWEREAMQAQEAGLRVTRLRMGMVLGREGGALPKMLMPFNLMLGGPIGPGAQTISWIHIQDLTTLLTESLIDERMDGPVNAVSPNPVPMREFCQILGRVTNKPSWLPVPAWVLKAGLGELATMMTHGSPVLPDASRRWGFTFRYPDLEPALRNLLGKEGGEMAS